MNQYKIVCLKGKFNELVEIYPQLVQLLYSSQNDVYDTKQIELLFQPISDTKEKLIQMMSQREDYSYFHGIHKLFNPLTEETVHIQLNEYDISVQENEENHAIFDIIQSFSKNFYMIKS